ncbi:DDE-type integrase/transposase/recombinase [Nocardia seriolae]|uniref:DDE-type integrase/transposase/recombinase n=1 Tax=Nocardia seriolae TaxID=37332 RepID=UPI0029540183|nr:DDE-type integrase/transposase/recombinase [Nocardia seriolae]
MATVEDRFSGRLLGYATSAHHDAELACAALKMAAATRGGFDVIDGVIFHSDRGSEYTAAATNALSPSTWAWCSRWAGSPRPWTTPRPNRSIPP